MANVLITGGAGFIGSNLALRLIRQGHEVTIYDNLSRPWNYSNLNCLSRVLGDHSFRICAADIRDFRQLEVAARGQDWIFHLAAQTAVPASFRHPVRDAQENVLGTINALKAARLAKTDPVFIYASTNKVYGGLEHIPIREEPTRYIFSDLPYGVSENFLVDGNSPYACSKAAGEAYTRDYARNHGIRSLIFRQSCIYGPHQFGTEEQGWVAWFVRSTLLGKPISLFGDGRQLRDILYIDDLLDLYCSAATEADRWSGEVFNIGGGTSFCLSIWSEFSSLLQQLSLKPPKAIPRPPRLGDQRVYISDVRKAAGAFDWHPTVSPIQGVAKVLVWIREECPELKSM